MAKLRAPGMRAVPQADDLAAKRFSPPTAPVSRANPLVFISHDSRDADLAEAFDHLLTDASGGVIRTFRSSDQTGRAGIDYGEDWFSKITKVLTDASDVVALLTPNSVGRPWILFEAGFAVGQRGTKVYGIALGVPFAKATSGPFARFQNCEAKEETLTTVVLDLIHRNPNATPREEAVRRQVKGFLADIDPLLKQRAQAGTEPEEMDATAAAKLFEEVKVMFRDLPTRVEGHLREHGMTRRRRHLHPMMFEEIFHVARAESGENLGAAWLFIASFLRDEIPWLSEAALQLHRAYQVGDMQQVESAQTNIRTLLRMMRHSRMSMREFEGDEESYMFLRHLPEMLEHFA
ncbi:MAG: toll/interleukin-1 receptor domain-containing protein, partial [Bryobacteraceae bacterium]